MCGSFSQTHSVLGFTVRTGNKPRTKVEVKRLEGLNQGMFSVLLSHLAAEATSYYTWALAVTIIIIRRRPELKNRSAHLADELPNDLLKKEMAPGQPACQHSVFPLLSPPLSLVSLAHSTLCLSHLSVRLISSSSLNSLSQVSLSLSHPSLPLFVSSFFLFLSFSSSVFL